MYNCPFPPLFFSSILYSSHLRREIKARGVSARVILKPSVRPASSFLNPLPGKEPLLTRRVNIQQQAGPLRDKTSTCGCLRKWGEETFQVNQRPLSSPGRPTVLKPTYQQPTCCKTISLWSLSHTSKQLFVTIFKVIFHKSWIMLLNMSSGTVPQ